MYTQVLSQHLFLEELNLRQMITFIYWKLTWKMKPNGVEGKAGAEQGVRTEADGVRPQDFRMAREPLTR